MADRFDAADGQPTMKAVVTMGNGGFEMLEYREVPIPEIGPGEVLLQVLAAGVNNTEINTRLGWYSRSVTTATSDQSTAQEKHATAKRDGGWDGATPFPFIQGTDCCGQVVEIADDVDADLLEKRVLVRACIRSSGFESLEHIWMGSNIDGAFAQYVKVPAREVFAVECDWTHAELATVPCAYGTAENLLHRADVSKDEHVLIFGASGGVGSAAVQLAKRRGALVTAIAGSDKMDQVSAIGADKVLERNDDIVENLGSESVDVVVDIVAGPNFPGMLKVLRCGGRYTSAGAIAGPMVELDMRDLYLKDLSLIGCTAWDKPVFPNLVSYVERGEIRPLLAREFPLSEIADAQREFLEKRHVGNFVLIPPT